MAIFGRKKTEDETPVVAEPTEDTNSEVIDDETTDTTNVDETPAPEVIANDDDGELEVAEVAEVAKSQERRQCQGLFVIKDASEFTQNENYSDAYLKSKGLFKGE